VPHFGEDTDITDAKVNLALVEKDYDHKLVVPEKEDPRKMNYFVPHFGSDDNIRASMKNLDEAEKTYKHELEVTEDGEGSYSLLQTDADLNLESDPICSSAGCTQYKHKTKGLGYKINYPVPNFGADSDIIESKASLKLAEELQGHELDLPNKKWRRPKQIDYDFNMSLDGDVIDTMKNLDDSEK
jgi:hypothetical protein